MRKTKKTLDFIYSSRFFPFKYSPNLLLVQLSTISRDDVSKEIHFGHVPFALLERQGQWVFLLALSHFLCQSDTILFTPAINKDVDKVDDYSMIDHIPTYLTHHIAECFVTISQPEWHD